MPLSVSVSIWSLLLSLSMRLFSRLLLILLSITTLPLNASTKSLLIPVRAYTYLPTLYSLSKDYLPDFPLYGYFGALIEHESCIHLYHSRCWSPRSRLKTKREEGAGLGQLTRAYDRYGNIRFDTIKRLRKQYLSELKDLTWSNVYDRPDLQIKAILLLYRENYQRLILLDIPTVTILAMADAAYNGGIRDVFRDRRLCSLSKNCNPNYWFDNIEKTCTKSKRILYGNRNACDINRYHVRDILTVRIFKYQKDYYYRHPSKNTRGDY